MPPPIEHDDSSEGEDEIPFRDPQAPGKDEEDPIGDLKVPNNVGEQDEDDVKENGDDDDDDDKYVVEKILSHRFDLDGTLKFEVKWEGYAKKSDRTWEPEENLDEAKDILNEYFESIGGKPFQQAKSTGKKARFSGATPDTGSKGKKRRLDDAETNTPAGKKWKPPAGNWEELVMDVDTIEQNAEDGRLQVFLAWNDGHKSKHPIEVAYQKCPLKMLHFYEQHLVFKEGGGGKISNGS